MIDPSSEVWTLSTDQTALFAPDAITFARRLADVRTLRFEFRPYNQAGTVATFDVSGIEPKLAQISTACNWSEVDKIRARKKANSAAARLKDHPQAGSIKAKVEEYVYECGDDSYPENKSRPAGPWCWAEPTAWTGGGTVHGPYSNRPGALQEAMSYARFHVK